MISFRYKGDFKKTEGWLGKLKELRFMKQLNQFGQLGVEALSSATPVDSGLTASSWTYEIQNGADEIIIEWHNTNINRGVNIAVILQTGHGTRNGGYVQGRDYINPAIQPIFDKLAKDAWEEVTKV